MRKLYDEWLCTEGSEKAKSKFVSVPTKTRHGNLRPPSKTQMVEFLLLAWGDIPREMVKKAFHCCGQSQGAEPEDVHCLKPGQQV